MVCVIVGGTGEESQTKAPILCAVFALETGERVRIIIVCTMYVTNEAKLRPSQQLLGW